MIALYTTLLDFFLAIIIYFTREGLAYVFTNDEEIIPMVIDGYTVMLFILMLHGFAMIQAGAVRGLGMLELATWMVFFAFYFISLPAAYIFAFKLEMGMVGLWWGVVAGSVTEIILYFIFLRFICDW